MSILARASRSTVARSVPSTRSMSVSASAARFLNANIFRSNAVFVATTLGAAVFATGAYEAAFDNAWKSNNQGKLFEDCIKRYPGLPPNCDDGSE